MNFIYKLVTYFKKPKQEIKSIEDCELTDWYPSEVKPVHKGFYEVKSKVFVSVFLKWDGENWLYSDDTICPFHREWRGIKR